MILQIAGTKVLLVDGISEKGSKPGQRFFRVVKWKKQKVIHKKRQIMYLHLNTYSQLWTPKANNLLALRHDLEWAITEGIFLVHKIKVKLMTLP